IRPPTLCALAVLGVFARTPELPALSPRGRPAPDRHLLAPINPNLDSNDSKGSVRLRESIVDVRAQRVKRQPALQVPFGAGYLGSVQPARDPHLDSLRAESLSAFDRPAHCSPESYPLLELLGNLFSLQLCIELRLMDLLDIDIHFPASPLLDLLLQLVDLGALPADDNAGTRSVDNDLQLVGGPLNVNMRDASARESLFQLLLELQVLMQKIRIVALGNPVGVPATVVTQPESVWMNLLTHVYLHRAASRPAP